MNIRRIIVSVIAAGTMMFATALPTFADTTVVVTGNTAPAENQPGWMFNRDLSTSTPYAFDADKASIGSGSLHILPIGSNASDKFIAENFIKTAVADLNSISYDFLIGGTGTVSDAQQFYLNVYANSVNDNKFYDCRFDYVPAAGSTSVFTTATFNATDTPVNVQQSGTARITCPATLSQMPSGSYVRAFSISVGDTSASDQGLAGYLDKVVVNMNGGITTYDFEPYVAPSVPTITVPANGAHVTSAALVKVDWTDSTGTNPPFEYQYEAYGDSGYSSLIYQSGWLTSSEIPTSGTPVGDYWMRVKARDALGTESTWSNGSGNPYHITVVPLVGPPTLVSQCKNNGWQTFNNPPFANQGDCVSYVRAHSHSVLGNVKYTAYGLLRSAQFAADTADGGGAFQYSDANHAWYRVLITSLKVDGHNAWFAGRVWQASNPSWVGNWLFAKVNDSSPKRIWGSFTTKTAAESGVSTMGTPADGPFNTIGAVVVH